MHKNKLKILFISGSYPPAVCGIGDYIQLLTNTLAKISNSINICILTSSYNTKKLNYPVKVMPVINNWKLSNVNNILNIVSNIAPDIVHIQYPTVEYKKNVLFNLLPFFIKKINSSIKIINTFHEPINELSILGQLRMIPNILFSDGLIFVEKEGYEKLPFFLKILSYKKYINIIPVASNIPKAKKSWNFRNKLVKKFNIPLNKKIIVTFGFINKTKNFEILFPAIDFSKFAWVHIGKLDKNDPYHTRFFHRLLEKNINIYFTGYLSKSNVAKTLACADICVFPFINGISPRHATFLAAANQDSYIIATNNNKTGYDKKENIFYIPPKNLDYLKKAIEFHLKYRSYSLKREFVLDWKTIAEKHLDFYKKFK